MKKGFTLVEILLVMGIFSVLIALTSINFFSTYNRSNLNAAKDVLVADIKTAQSNAMSGKGENGLALPGWGIKITSDTRYVIFPGSVYDASNSTNMLTDVPSGVTLTTTLPSSSVIFAHGSGEVVGYISGQDAITLLSSTGSHIIRLNQYGTIIGD